MEKIEFYSLSNLSQRCDSVRLNESFGNGKLFGYVGLTLSILLITLCETRVRIDLSHRYYF